MSVVYRFKNFRGRNWSWRLVHYHRVGGATTAAAWVGLGAAFGKPYMETILSCGVPMTLNKVWDTTSKINTRREAAYQELYMKDRNRDK